MKNQEVLDLLHAALYGMDELLRSFSITHEPIKSRSWPSEAAETGKHYWDARNQIEKTVKHLERLSEVRVERTAKRIRRSLERRQQA